MCSSDLIPTTRRDHCVRVEPIVVMLGNGSADRLDVSARMKALDNCKVGERSLLARDVMETLLLESLLYGPQPVGPLGVSEARVMLKTGRMSKQERSSHERFDTWAHRE